MKLIFDLAREQPGAGTGSDGTYSGAAGSVQLGSVRHRAFGVQLQPSPRLDHVRRGSPVTGITTPPTGLSGSPSRLAKANREWFVWRFGEDA